MTVANSPTLNTTLHTGARHAWLGLDLTGLGVAEDLLGVSEDLPVEKADLARLASYTRAAHGAGIGLVTLGAEFRLRSDRAVRDGRLDPVSAARRIAPHASAGLVAEVSGRGAVATAEAELAQAHPSPGTWHALHLSLTEAARLASSVRPDRRRTRVVVSVSALSEAAAAGAFADIVRIRQSDLEQARELRLAVRAAARTAGREGAVTVLADLHLVVASERESAIERAGLVAEIAGGSVTPWEGALSAHGTPYDVADLIEHWLAVGAADGFVVIPGSVPADVAGLIRAVVPELQVRGVLAKQSVAAPAGQHPAPRVPAPQPSVGAPARALAGAAVPA
ncbi:hypothetical protein [Bogoriella caseilytica]|uniref:Alkanesulfonate monooxygenase SsuD/methylene tetrahydromethanopterin reductase-like flavin-dependent oxidoreductase (Luciferase family) n=1 Tax=Bogoriella caseilytica TaxID=56055 RepID=A0A3N2B9S1_9MICO|nr:hypothetical protein [Bogoriella caseilytica]ROR71892.1 hypothetical protein EDD31_0231 [Bogoriella caseilytica]